MTKKARMLGLLCLSSVLLNGCLGSLWTAGSLFYDRHNVYRKMDDYTLASEANYLISNDHFFQREDCVLDIAVFNGDLLLAGHVSTPELRQEAIRRLEKLPYREFFKQVGVKSELSGNLEDSWITTKIRSQIVADSEIDPNDFKIITVDNIVYIMGDVKPKQAKLVIDIARNTEGVLRVVKLLRYYNLSDTPGIAG